jgi:hypothetical protein
MLGEIIAVAGERGIEFARIRVLDSVHTVAHVVSLSACRRLVVSLHHHLRKCLALGGGLYKLVDQ